MQQAERGSSPRRPILGAVGRGKVVATQREAPNALAGSCTHERPLCHGRWPHPSRWTASLHTIHIDELARADLQNGLVACLRHVEAVYTRLNGELLRPASGQPVQADELQAPPVHPASRDDASTWWASTRNT
eukprot:scaffold2126_cov417-Prasinococcus_capsulatus_cf.AAC.2